MGRYLFTVADTFVIKGRGIVLTPASGKYRIAVGWTIELRRPDGAIRTTVVRGIEMLDPPPFDGRYNPGILVPADISLDDVPVGTEVWTCE
jgi:translation elongation factor EF-Tu-like GTPase